MTASLSRWLSRQRQDSRWIPWLFVAFFGVIFIVNGIMVYFAISSWAGVTTSNHYREGLTYNQRLAEAKQQASLGWQMVVAQQAGQGASKRLLVTLQDASGEPLLVDRVEALLQRPLERGYDQRLVLRSAGSGRYSADVEMPLAGNWNVKVTARRGLERYQQSERLFVQP